MASNTFFVKLKETCQKIDSDVNDIKAKVIGSRNDHDKEEIISKKICHIQDKINALKTDANDLRNMLEPKLEHTSNFIKNIKELMADTEVWISNREENLKQYGYIPVEAVPQIPDENNLTPDKKIKEDLPVTPNLLDYGIPSYTLATTPELNQMTSFKSAPPDLIPTTKLMKSYKHSVSTPTLDVAAVSSTSKPNETPPFPEPLYTLAKETPPFPEPLYTPAKETPPFPEPLYTATKETPPLPDSLYATSKETRPLVYNSVNFPSTPKLNI